MCKYSELININGDGGYGHYNVQAAATFGLETAVYIQWLIFVDVKSDQKNTKTADGYMKVDRKFIEKMTSLSPASQREMDKLISNVNVVSIHPDNSELIKLDSVEFIKLITSKSADKNNSKVITDKTVKRKTKIASISDNLKSVVWSADLTTRVSNSLCTWIDTLLESGKAKVNKQSVLNAIDFVKKYWNGNEDVIIEIINKAAGLNYLDLGWSYEQYLRFNKVTSIPSVLHKDNNDFDNTTVTTLHPEGEF